MSQVKDFSGNYWQDHVVYIASSKPYPHFTFIKKKKKPTRSDLLFNDVMCRLRPEAKSWAKPRQKNSFTHPPNSQDTVPLDRDNL